MKKIVLIIAFLITSVFADVNWVEDIDDAYEIAAKENKKVMVMLSKEGCSACDYMKGIVFKDKNFSNRFNRGLVAVHIDIYKGFIPDGLEFFATPTFYFLDANEKIIHRINGAHNSKDFSEELELFNLLK